MKWTALAVVLATTLVCACGAKPTSAAHSPAATAAATASAATLSCRLPVAGFAATPAKGQPYTGPADGQQGTGGFLDLPSGKYTPTPESDVSYLASAHVWLPVQPQAISPDQRSYVRASVPAYSATAPTSTLYLVQVATKAERLFFTAPDGQMAFVLAFSSDGVYVVTTSSSGPGPSQLLLVDPVTGAYHAVPGSQMPNGAIQQIFMAVSGNFAWGMQLTGDPQQPSFKLVRLNLRDGSVVDWYDAGGPYFVAGFDAADNPIVAQFVTSFSNVELFLIPARNQTVAIQPRTGTFVPGRTSYLRDTHGTWFGSGDGSIWLYSETTGMTKVATVPVQPGASAQPGDPMAARTVAGPCV